MNAKLQNYLVGISWFILSLVSSSLNDVIAKYAGLRLSSSEVTFFRLLFGALTLLPFIFYYGKNTLKTARPLVHFSRGGLLFFAMTAWTYGLTIAPVTTATVISFTVPLFVLVLAVFLLKERIIWQRWAATLVGFFGVIVMFKPHESDFNPRILSFVLAAIAFAILDIINKIFVIKESMISMLFYSAAVAALLSAPYVIMHWQAPTLTELFLMFILGASGNLLLFFILKAFSMVDLTATSPYRYLELVISAVTAYFVFNEVPTATTLYGALIVIPATLFVIYSEKKVITETTDK